MKLRNGFVSNSSSSSFCIIGTDYDSEIAKLITAEGKNYGHYDKPKPGKYYGDWIEGKDYLSYGNDSGKLVTFYGNDEVQYAGIDAKELLEKFSLPDARIKFCELVKDELGVEINPRTVDLHYGEAGNG